MDRKKFSAVLDEAVNQLESEVSTLKNQQANISVNLKELEKTRNKLSEEIKEYEDKLKNIKKEYKDEVDAMLKAAQDKVNSANKKDAELAGKLGELSQKQKDADDIVKSNKGLQKNLEIAKKENDELKVKLNDIVSSIKKILE